MRFLYLYMRKKISRLAIIYRSIRPTSVLCKCMGKTEAKEITTFFWKPTGLVWLFARKVNKHKLLKTFYICTMKRLLTRYPFRLYHTNLSCVVFEGKFYSELVAFFKIESSKCEQNHRFLENTAYSVVCHNVQSWVLYCSSCFLEIFILD